MEEMRARVRAAAVVVRGAAVGAVLLSGALLAGSAAWAQATQPPATQGSCTFTDENGKVQTLPNCGIPAGEVPPTSPAAPGAAKSFPFPGEGSGNAGNGSSSGGNSGLPAAPGAGTQPRSGSAAGSGGSPVSPAPASSSGNSNLPSGQRFPFPGENPAGAGANQGGAKPGLQDAGSSGSSNGSGQGSGSSSGSSDSSNSNSDDNGAGPMAGDKDAAAAAAAARHRERVAAENAEPVLTDAARESEDMRVASFYQNDGDYRGAYLRAKDAVSLANDDAEAHLALAEAARKLGKLDEAEANYKKCLTLDPVPKVRKAAERALKEMEGGG